MAVEKLGGVASTWYFSESRVFRICLQAVFPKLPVMPMRIMSLRFASFDRAEL